MPRSLLLCGLWHPRSLADFLSVLAHQADAHHGDQRRRQQFQADLRDSEQRGLDEFRLHGQKRLILTADGRSNYPGLQGKSFSNHVISCPCLYKNVPQEKFVEIDSLWVPAFVGKKSVTNASGVAGLQLRKGDKASFVAQAEQECTVELFTAPSSDGTPVISPDYPDGQKVGLVEDSFVFIANQISLDESLEMPLAVIHVDRSLWRSL